MGKLHRNESLSVRAILLSQKYPKQEAKPQAKIPTLSEWEAKEHKKQSKEKVKSTKKTIMTTQEQIKELNAQIASLTNAFNTLLSMQEPKATKKTEPKPKATKKAEPKARKSAKNAKPNIEMLQYSDKSYAIIGDTKPIKDILKENGGRFCPFLTVDGQKTAGWIFNLKNAEKVEKVLNKYYAK